MLSKQSTPLKGTDLVSAHLSATGERARVTVLMASFNGLQWIDEQIDSILAQDDVDVRLVISDDGSHDGTYEHCVKRAEDDPRIRVLPPRCGVPGVTANFLHLFTQHVPDGSYVAFSDQDDVWHADKLAREVAVLEQGGADVCSSNVVAVGADGSRRLICKSQPQRRWDHIFEAAGPGSTYVFTPAAHEKLQEVLRGLDYSRIGVHDWYLYALARAVGLRWRILAHPTVDYRQHGGNVQGANSGALARQARVEKLRSGFYREQFILTARAVLDVCTYDPGVREELSRLIDNLESQSIGARWSFLAKWLHIRRSRVEAAQLAGARIAGIW